MTRTIETLIGQLDTIEPYWTFLLASGYIDHHESNGQNFFCHLMHRAYNLQPREELHVFAFADTAFDAFDRALEKLIARQS